MGVGVGGHEGLQFSLCGYLQLLSSLGSTSAFSSHVPSSSLAHTFKVMTEILWCHTWSSVSTIQWDRCRDPIDPLRGDGRPTAAGQDPKVGRIITRGPLTGALKQCVDNSIILKIHVSSTEEQEKNWSERGKLELSEKNSVTVWVKGG